VVLLFFLVGGVAGSASVPFPPRGGAGGGGGAGAPGLAGRVLAAAPATTPAQVKLAWTLQQGPHVLAIPGTTDPAHLEENVAAGSLRLGEAELERLGAPDA
ncbi:aldo/keto reductase, partial [Streptomyces albidoflavus]